MKRQKAPRDSRNAGVHKNQSLREKTIPKKNLYIRTDIKTVNDVSKMSKLIGSGQASTPSANYGSREQHSASSQVKSTLAG